jgi:ArsR family transcriptional regulator, arsenate/arsenite/antimonite-responsive transcriptional repressor
MSNIEKELPFDCCAAFQALGNPHRLSIFLRLAKCCQPGVVCGFGAESTCVGEIVEDLGIAASTVSHHLKELRNAGLIHMARNGQQVECWVEPETLKNLSGFFRDVAPGLVTE